MIKLGFALVTRIIHFYIITNDGFHVFVGIPIGKIEHHQRSRSGRRRQVIQPCWQLFHQAAICPWFLEELPLEYVFYLMLVYIKFLHQQDWSQVSTFVGYIPDHMLHYSMIHITSACFFVESKGVLLTSHPPVRSHVGSPGALLFTSK